MACGCNSNKRQYVAVDPVTGDCLLYTGEECRRFHTRAGALAAAQAAGHEGAGVLRR